MSKKITFICELANGVHARPASHVERVCSPFTSSIRWHNTRTDIGVDAKSVLSLISSNTLQGDECYLIIDGQDEEEAFVTLKNFIEQDFPICDDQLIHSESCDDILPLPRSLANLHPDIIRAKSVCGGTAHGKLQCIRHIDIYAIADFVDKKSSQDTLTSVKTALKAVKNLLMAQISYAQDASKEILTAHEAILDDPAFLEQIEVFIHQGDCAGNAIIHTAKFFSEQLNLSGSDYLKERELDIRDICLQLLQQIYGDTLFPSQSVLSEPTICMADELTPSQFLELDKQYLKGLLLRRGGTTSHTIILARSFNIPTLVGVDIDQLQQYQGEMIQIDGNLGLVAFKLTTAVSRYYQLEEQLHDALADKQHHFLTVAGRTQDDIKVEIAANIAHPIEAKAAFDHGAESIGLFRTEMLYMDRHNAPNEDELYNTFCQAIDAAGQRSIIIRTFDIGGDKPVNYLNIPAENNPFLGYRAVRIYQEYLTLFRTQLRAILRASAHGNVKIMIPMISSMEEVIWVKKELSDIKQQLRENKIAFDERIPLGIMLEVPSIIFIIDQCCEEIDFFSVGSNDLTQYLLAVDRDNIKVSKHYNSLNPAFLRALDHIVKTVHHYGKWVGICGELAAKGSVLPLLVGLGFDELSMSAPNILSTKARLAKLDKMQCRLLLNQAIGYHTSLEVEHLLAKFRMNQGDVALLSKACITINPDWQSKEEVIKGMTDKLLVNERCRYPRKLEDDLWNREDIFSTALGHGFAIPHTKSEHIEQSTISVAKLVTPIKWGDEKVNLVIMLTLNKHSSGDQHMRIFSKLARKIMHETFRNQLIHALTAENITQILTQELEL